MGILSFLGSKDAEVTLEQMLAMARRGDGAPALQAAEKKVQAAATRSPAAKAAALFDLAQLCLFLGLVPRAIGALRDACEIKAEGKDGEKDRLTYLMNLGEVLAYDGQLEEALRVHDGGLVEREKFYGKAHPGYGFGLDSWADVALSLKRYREAFDAAKKALDIYEATGHERAHSAMGLMLLAAEGAEHQVKLEAMQPDHAAAVMQAVARRTVPVAAAVECKTLEKLEPYVKDAQTTLSAWAGVHGHARAQKDQASGAKALGKVRAIAEASGNGELALDAELGLGLCFDESGAHDEARRWYESAIERAKSLARPDARVKALRNAGLYFAQGQDLARGLAMLREAAAVEGGDPQEQARTRAALGIQLQHQGALEEAREVLKAALAALDPGHPDAVCATSHLSAIEAGSGCGCGDTQQALAEQVERLVRERLPKGMIESVKIVAGGNVEVHASRALSDAEGRQVADAVELARAEMRRRIKGAYGEG